MKWLAPVKTCILQLVLNSLLGTWYSFVTPMGLDLKTNLALADVVERLMELPQIWLMGLEVAFLVLARLCGILFVTPATAMQIPLFWMTVIGIVLVWLLLRYFVRHQWEQLKSRYRFFLVLLLTADINFILIDCLAVAMTV